MKVVQFIKEVHNGQCSYFDISVEMLTGLNLTLLCVCFLLTTDKLCRHNNKINISQLFLWNLAKIYCLFIYLFTLRVKQKYIKFISGNCTPLIHL